MSVKVFVVPGDRLYGAPAAGSQLIKVLMLIQFLMKKLKKMRNLFKKFFGKEVLFAIIVILINVK